MEAEAHGLRGTERKIPVPGIYADAWRHLYRVVLESRHKLLTIPVAALGGLSQTLIAVGELTTS